jgi:hypothetical protein
MKTKKLTFLLALTFLFVFSCSEQKPKPKITTIENPKVRESFENFVMPIIKSLDVDKLQKWGFGPYYDGVNNKLTNEFKVRLHPSKSQSEDDIKLGLMRGFLELRGSQKITTNHLPSFLILNFIKLSHNEPWKLITYGGFVDTGNGETLPTQSPDVHVYIKSKFETIEEMEYIMKKRSTKSDKK